jgi:hypothetical protein
MATLSSVVGVSMFGDENARFKPGILLEERRLLFGTVAEAGTSEPDSCVESSDCEAGGPL